MKGCIKLFIGPMFASKTSHMCNEVERYHIANKLCVTVKYSSDTRYDSLAKSGGIVTHAGREHSKVPVVRTGTLESIYDEISEYEVIGIDEVQFYPDCVEVIQKLANEGKIIICSGLDGNYLGKPFGRILELVPLAEEVVKLKAVCMVCSDDASFTARRGAAKTEIDIGGADKYIAVCRNCMWNRKH